MLGGSLVIPSLNDYVTSDSFLRTLNATAIWKIIIKWRNGPWRNNRVMSELIVPQGNDLSPCRQATKYPCNMTDLSGKFHPNPLICFSVTFLIDTYEVRDLFPWEMFTKMVISWLLNFEKIWNSAQIDLSSTLDFYRRRNNIHWEIDLWNRRRFGAKWLVTVPNSVAPVKPIVCKLI